jgi:hypothetical protein
MYAMGRPAHDVLWPGGGGQRWHVIIVRLASLGFVVAAGGAAATLWLSARGQGWGRRAAIVVVVGAKQTGSQHCRRQAQRLARHNHPL